MENNCSFIDPLAKLQLILENSLLKDNGAKPTSGKERGENSKTIVVLKRKDEKRLLMSNNCSFKWPPKKVQLI